MCAYTGTHVVWTQTSKGRGTPSMVSPTCELRMRNACFGIWLLASIPSMKSCTSMCTYLCVHVCTQATFCFAEMRTCLLAGNWITALYALNQRNARLCDSVCMCVYIYTHTRLMICTTYTYVRKDIQIQYMHTRECTQVENHAYMILLAHGMLPQKSAR